MTKDLLVAQRYAQALFEIARAEKADEWVEAELEALSASLRSDAAFESFLGNPAVKAEDKRRIVEKLYKGKRPGIDEMLVRFLLLLFEKHRFYLIHDVAVHFRKIADESQGQGVAEILSAVSMSQTQRDAITSRIEKITGKKMVVRAQVDGELIGGVVVKVGNRVIDDSVRAKIGHFKKELTKAQSV